MDDDGDYYFYDYDDDDDYITATNSEHEVAAEVLPHAVTDKSLPLMPKAAMVGDWSPRT